MFPGRIPGRRFARDAAQLQRLERAGRRHDVGRLDGLAVVEDDGDGTVSAVDDGADPGPQPQFAAELLEPPHEDLEDPPDPLERPAEPFLEDAAEHDHELGEIHVVGRSAPVKQERAEEHFGQQRVAEVFLDGGAGRQTAGGQAGDFVLVDPRPQLAKPVNLVGESLADLLRQAVDVVGKSQRAPRKDDRRRPLRRQVEVFPAQPKLPQDLAQWAGLGAGAGVIGEGVQPDVVIAAAEPIERIQPADGRVPLENADRFLVVSQADSGGQTRHSGADDDRVVSHGSL